MNGHYWNLKQGNKSGKQV